MSPLKISRCSDCNAAAWPIRPHCSRCFGQMRTVDAPDEGKICGYSQKDGDYFCVTEFGGVRVLCRLNSERPPKIGQRARFLNHKRSGQTQSFAIELA